MVHLNRDGVSETNNPHKARRRLASSLERRTAARKTSPRTYSVKETFYTLQGEGRNAGRAAVFCRFSGCNLWSGREGARKTAKCTFCDTDFVGTGGQGGGRFRSAVALADHILSMWEGDEATRFVVLTGGEPALQLDDGLILELKSRGFYVAVETNGTLRLPGGIDWICVSPKADNEVVLDSCSEVKLVYPQAGVDPARFERVKAELYYISPMNPSASSGPSIDLQNVGAAVSYCLAHPKWRLSMQMHKIVGIP